MQSEQGEPSQLNSSPVFPDSSLMTTWIIIATPWEHVFKDTQFVIYLQACSQAKNLEIIA